MCKNRTVSTPDMISPDKEEEVIKTRALVAKGSESVVAQLTDARCVRIASAGENVILERKALLQAWTKLFVLLFFL